MKSVRLNFITKLEVNADIKGISLAIVLNPNVVDASGKEYVTQEQVIKDWGGKEAKVNNTRSCP